jgi:tetratricopeptide (TPR) repeat protein
VTLIQANLKMKHVTKKELFRVSEAGQAEIARVAAHLSVCSACRSIAVSLLRDGSHWATREGPLKTLLELAAFEREAVVEQLLARAELAGLQKLTKGAQKKRLIQSRACHTPAFFDVLLAALRVPRPKEESEFLTNLAMLAVQGMDLKRNPAAFKNDLLATIWIDTANVRRINGEWHHAESALYRADHYFGLGTGNPSIKARWFSIRASLRIGQGTRAEAMDDLQECRRIYEEQGDWPLVARTLVKMAHCLVDHDPERGLPFVDLAMLLISPEDSALRWHAESNQAECLINLGRVKEALFAFGRAESLRPLQQRRDAQQRSTFTAARLLEALDRTRAAEILFEDALSSELHDGLHKDALLDLVYIVGFHNRCGAPERAEEITRHTLQEIEHQGTVLHDQLRSVFAGLIAAAQNRSLNLRMTHEVGEYLHAHWKIPSPTDPLFTAVQDSPALQTKELALENEELEKEEIEKLLQPLLASAEWSSLRRKTRREQQALVAASSTCHTKAFGDHLLAELRKAGSQDEAEFIAHLALRAAERRAEPLAQVEDFRARVWIEVADVRRKTAEWDHVEAALRKAEGHLAQGSGDPLLKARAMSGTAALYADQGDSERAVALLDDCAKLYESQTAWPFVASTWIQTAEILVESEPARALDLVERAFPLLPRFEIILRWQAGSLRTESLLELGEIDQALQAFERAETWRRELSRPDDRRRSDFTAARLLEAIGKIEDAERLFSRVIAEAFEREAYREAFLDILYLFGFHLRQGASRSLSWICLRLDTSSSGRYGRSSWMPHAAGRLARRSSRRFGDISEPIGSSRRERLRWCEPASLSTSTLLREFGSCVRAPGAGASPPPCPPASGAAPRVSSAGQGGCGVGGCPRSPR